MRFSCFVLQVAGGPDVGKRRVRLIPCGIAVTGARPKAASAPLHFMPESVIPSMKRRWAIRKAAISGVTITSAEAIIGP